MAQLKGTTVNGDLKVCGGGTIFGNVTGDITGNVTGDLSGNATYIGTESEHYDYKGIKEISTKVGNIEGRFTSAGVLNIANGGTGATCAELARTNLELGNAATKDVGTTNGTVAAGDHTHAPAMITGGTKGQILRSNGTTGYWGSADTITCVQNAACDDAGSCISTTYAHRYNNNSNCVQYSHVAKNVTLTDGYSCISARYCLKCDGGSRDHLYYGFYSTINIIFLSVCEFGYTREFAYANCNSSSNDRMTAYVKVPLFIRSGQTCYTWECKLGYGCCFFYDTGDYLSNIIWKRNFCGLTF